LIKFLQDAAGKGELDPWDIDVISVIDSFLEQYSLTFNQSSNSQISYHKDLAETSEAFFAASVLVNLKAQVLESDVFKENSSDFEDEFDLRIKIGLIKSLIFQNFLKNILGEDQLHNQFLSVQQH